VPHDVFNQAPPLEGYDVFGQDVALVDALEREGAGWAADRAHAVGELAGGEAIALGFQANEHPPKLRTHDRYGNRIDEVEFHPAWHRLMALGIEHGLHALPWLDPRPGAHVARAAMFVALAQAEQGFGCPISMTYASIQTLRLEPSLAAEWEPRLLSTTYDPTVAPAAQKRGALCGMAMTERQGGSDVRANTTRATPLGGEGEFELTGHKWFCSAPMNDAFLVLAQAPGGLSCFLLPRWRPDGARNGFHIQRLKDKLGNRSNASAEVEFEHAWARLIGEQGRGVPTIIEMVNHTRLDCVLGSAGLMRQAVAQATHHAAYRSAFGAKLIDQPLMRNVLADLCIESEGATLASMRLARAYDESAGDPQARLFARLATAVVKYWVCKRTPPLVAEALECLGGNGFVEDSGMPRLYRESPLNSIWEGSGNVICLDVLRAMQRSPQSVDAFFDEVGRAEGAEPRLDAFAGKLRDDLADADQAEARARRLVEQMALAFQASLLVRHAHPAIASAFVASRLEGDRGLAFGTLPAGTDFAAIVERARPKLDRG
jgi:putative acyl-CoA dehydrogenase